MDETQKPGEGAGPRALARAVPRREAFAADRVRTAQFPTALRGYDREAVDAFVAEVAELIDTLESRQTRETVVQRALEEVGEETSAILKQAHESADDITARSRSQAEDRVEIAREEAAAITREARAEAAALKRETQDLQLDRANLIEELRRFAAETLAVADAAAGRMDTAQPGLADPPYDGDQALDGREPLGGTLDDPGALDPDEALEGDREHAIDGLDGSAALDPTEEWPAEHDPGEPTDELSVPLGEREDEPPRPGG